MKDALHNIEPGPSASHYDLAIVGAGIVGLATAREFLLRQPALHVIVLEKEAAIASQQSGHNSGVIHSGIYYAPGSLKARACVEGQQAMLAFCREQGIPFELCGKVIVALDESELPRLEDLYQRGIKNSVQGLEFIGPERLRELEPYAAGIKAIHSPNTGIIDYVQVAQAYAREVREHGGEIVTGCEVTALTTRDAQTVLGIRQTGVVTLETEIHARYVITCGGLQSDKLSRMSGKECCPGLRSRGLRALADKPRRPVGGIELRRLLENGRSILAGGAGRDVPRLHQGGICQRSAALPT